MDACVVFEGGDCIHEMLEHVLLFKGEAKRIINKIVEYSLYLIDHNGSGLDSYVVLNNLSQWRSVVNLIKNGAVIASLKVFNGCVDENKKLPDMFIWIWGVHINKTLTKKVSVINDNLRC